MMVTFASIRGVKQTIKAEAEGIYNNMLHNIIEQKTGLYLSL